MLLIKNGRVIDPASGTDAVHGRVDRWRVGSHGSAQDCAAARKSSPAEVLDATRLGLLRQGSLICIATCASRARKFPKQLKQERGRRRAEVLPLSAACPIPRRSTTMLSVRARSWTAPPRWPASGFGRSAPHQQAAAAKRWPKLPPCKTPESWP